MDSQIYQAPSFNEKAGLDDEVSVASQELDGLCKANRRRSTWRRLKTLASVALFIVVWQSLDAIPNPFKVDWNGRTIKNGLEERHMSFDTVRRNILVLRYWY